MKLPCETVEANDEEKKIGGKKLEVSNNVSLLNACFFKSFKHLYYKPV